MIYHFKIHKETKGYWAECVELKGCITQGDTKDKLYKNMKEALNLYLDEPAGSDIVDLLPDEKIDGRNIVPVPVEPEIAFSVVMRHLRKKHKMTQQQIADKLGMKKIYSYQRLERKSNPSLEMLSKIREVFPDFSVDMILKDV